MNNQTDETTKLKKENAILKQKLADFYLPTEEQAKAFSDFIDGLQVIDGHSIASPFEEIWKVMVSTKIKDDIQ